MGYEIILIGEKISLEDLKNYGEENVAIKDNIALVNLRNSTLAHRFIQEMKKLGTYEVLSLEEYEEIMKTTPEDYKPLENVVYKDCISWQFDGKENFVVSNDNTLSVWDVEFDNVQKQVDFPIRGNILLSNSGMFMANYFENRLVLYVEKFDKIFTNFEFKEDIKRVEFNDTDTLLLVYTTEINLLIETYTGKILKEMDKPCIFNITGDNVIYTTTKGIKDGIKDGIISLMGEDIKKVDIIKAKHGQMMI
ncbi:hypothetical protein NGRA_1906, partial [Nosema granulosis]